MGKIRYNFVFKARERDVNSKRDKKVAGCYLKISPLLIVKCFVLFHLDLSAQLNFSVISNQTEKLRVNAGIQIGHHSKDCGLSFSCSSDEFSAYIFTGFENKIYPKLCLDGKYVFDENLNGCGRGINVAVIDNVTKSLLRVSNFDTYSKDSVDLETMLLTLRPGDILILITFDEPSTKLSYVTKLLLHELSSALAQDLQYRSSWFLATQKGIVGYSPYEKLNFPTEDGWGKSSEFRGCLPFQFQGIKVRPDETVVQNRKRVEFCAKYNTRWPLFCEGRVLNDELIPSKILRPLPINADIAKTPLVVFGANDSNEYLSLTLETIIRQPGIVCNNVIVFYKRNAHPSLKSLIEFFGFRSHHMDEKLTKDDVLQEVRIVIKILFPNTKQYIVVDENALLSPDFFPFMGQLLSLLHHPKSNLVAINAFNENGLSNTSYANNLVFRASLTNYPPKFAAMIKSDFDLKLLDRSYAWSLFNSNLSSYVAGDIILPDVSRVLYANSISQSLLSSPEENIFAPTVVDVDFNVNTEPEVLLKEVDILTTAKSYGDAVLKQLNKSSRFYELQHFKKDFIANTYTS
ncbi:protein O-linked-mannose beta-1:2-N-acetylglucosaminyltransferase 1-like isoform X3, partial [Dinothrombium tinctorium]